MPSGQVSLPGDFLEEPAEHLGPPPPGHLPLGAPCPIPHLGTRRPHSGRSESTVPLPIEEPELAASLGACTPRAQLACWPRVCTHTARGGLSGSLSVA